MRDVESIIVGGGPAGSSCARELITSGRNCLVLERKRMPRVKLCAGWVTPKVIADLDIQPAEYPHGIVQLDTLKIFFGRKHRFSITTKTSQYSIRRVEFDAWLLKRSGAQVAQHTVRHIERENGSFSIDGEFRCQYLVGAGGTNCPVKKAFFDDHYGKRLVTQEVEYTTTPRHSVCTLWFPYAGSFGYAWYVPKADAVNIGFGGLRSHLKDWDRRALWQEFVALLKQQSCIDEDPPQPKGYSYYIGRRTTRVRNGNAFIVGDAAGLATLDLAEGIGPAVESGILAAAEIVGRATYSSQPITKYTLAPTVRSLRRMANLLP